MFSITPDNPSRRVDLHSVDHSPQPVLRLRISYTSINMASIILNEHAYESTGNTEGSQTAELEELLFANRIHTVPSSSSKD